MKRELISSLLKELKKENKEPNNCNRDGCIKMYDYLAF